MDKKTLRKQFIALREEKPIKELALLSERLMEHLMILPAYQTAKTVMTYLSTPFEVDTHRLVQEMLKEGKRVCVPLCQRGTNVMNAHEIHGFEGLKPGVFGILEPIEQNLVPTEEIDLILVPGCVFGKNRHRIGYGKGYYDRFLGQKRSTTKAIGLCFDFCLIEEVPHESFDVKLDSIITENGVAV